jgi:hypothetical protein
MTHRSLVMDGLLLHNKTIAEYVVAPWRNRETPMPVVLIEKGSVVPSTLTI